MDQVEEEIVNLETNIFSGFMLVSGLFIPGINKLLSISINLTPGWNHQLVNNFSEVFFRSRQVIRIPVFGVASWIVAFGPSVLHFWVPFFQGFATWLFFFGTLR